MKNKIKADIGIIGGGAGGLSIAAVAAQAGAKVVLVEKGKMGGDCLNYGCVPSKSLLAIAKTAQTMRQADHFGIESVEPKIDIKRVMQNVQSVVNTLSVHDSIERFEKLGVKVIQASGSFQDKKTLLAAGSALQARRFVIANGSSPAIPTIPGLENVRFYTNETIFTLTQSPSQLIVIGGGPIGCELAQAFLLLGVKVILVEGLTILPREEDDIVATLRETFLEQGLVLYEKSNVLKVMQSDGEIAIVVRQNDQVQTITGSHLLIATGRQPNVDNLNLEMAGVKYTRKGIEVDSQLRTTNPLVYAIGDVVGPYQFTHIANYHAGIVLRNILFKIPAKVNYAAVPWVTYTHPELAHVGMTTKEANEKNIKIKNTDYPFAGNDRAQTEHDTVGKIKVMTDAHAKVLGVTILGPHAGELIVPWINLIQHKQSIRMMTDMIIPYPTLSEISKRVAGEYYSAKLFSPLTKWLVNSLKYFG